LVPPGVNLNPVSKLPSLYIKTFHSVRKSSEIICTINDHEEFCIKILDHSVRKSSEIIFRPRSSARLFSFICSNELKSCVKNKKITKRSSYYLSTMCTKKIRAIQILTTNPR
jgi:hypothetical protein